MLTWLMQLTLVLPGLLWPEELTRDICFDLPADSLARLIALGQWQNVISEAAWLSQAIQLDRPLPAAALRLLGEGIRPGEHNWLAIDPVHLRLSEHTILLDAPNHLDLSETEDAALRSSLQEIFADWGEIVAPNPGHWHLRLARPLALDTMPLWEAIAQKVDPLLPGGQDGRQWRGLLAEAQPSLHMHAVNRQRELARQASVNSLWLWGAGKLPAAVELPFDHVWADDPVYRGMTILGKRSPMAAMPKFQAESGRVLVKLEQLVPAFGRTDALAWREALLQLESDWFAPLLTALKRGHCRQLQLIATGHHRARRLTVNRLDLLRFWRPKIGLADGLV